ncbi:ATP-grasp domain-containing protein [Ktedonospora formicarum]|uniref:Phosphoribosylglycinamide synthetase n=1 Tax=Ktedonospora formicarum TaxID=2778364 RepID=A0A8J3HWT5_9CHLR|nr:ATP-grasp domain-containing protein [Ktedonospora formicarum]GHO42308.1 phosphoribosylglycinamide synthetase [Ktedonospora formicarum]
MSQSQKTHILIIGPTGSGLLYMTAARALGMHVSVLTVDEIEYDLPEAMRCAIDDLIMVEDWNMEGLLRHALDLHHKLPLSGVVAGDEFRVDETAFIARTLDLAGITPEVMEGVRNKAITRARLASNGVYVPNFAVASTLEEVIEASKRIAFPCVIKPVNLAGSVGVCRVHNRDELIRAYHDALNKDNYRKDFPSCMEVIIEDFLVGTEYSVDGYVSSDGIEVISATEARLGREPHFQEIGHLSYRLQDLPFHRSLETYIRSVVKALGIKSGPFHSEIMMTKDGPALIEIAARLAGDHLPELVEKVSGICMPESVLAALTGYEMPERKKPQSQVAVIQYIVEPRLAGLSYRELRGWDEVLALPSVFHSAISIKPGEPIPLQEDFRSRIACVMYLAESREQALQIWDYIEQKVTVIA